MIESALFFALGFLCAGFLALMIAPAIWRRAVHLTRRRIEASVPLTLNELTAEKDRIRAEFAMATRRLEMSQADLRTRNAEQAVEVARSREELKRLATEREEQSAAIARLEAEAADLRSRIGERDEELRRSASQLDEANRALEARAVEVNRLNALYEEATFTASGRQIELVARESEVEKLADDVSRMTDRQRDLGRRLGEADSEYRAATGALEAEKRRTAELERKLERLLATIADREEKIDRQEKELVRLQEQARDEPAGDEDASQDASGRRQRLESRLATLMRENRKLRERLAGPGQAAPAGSDNAEAGVPLRDQISDLAAQVINMTILLEGKDSAAGRVIAQAGNKTAEAGRPMTLAERVRALQQAAAGQ